MLYFLDTSALKWAYLRGKFHRRCRYLLSRCQGRVFVAEISLLELVSVLGDELHQNRLTLKQFAKLDLLLLDDIAEGRLEVRTLPSSETIGVRLAHAGENQESKGAKVSGWDHRLHGPPACNRTKTPRTPPDRRQEAQYGHQRFGRFLGIGRR